MCVAAAEYLGHDPEVAVKFGPHTHVTKQWVKAQGIDEGPVVLLESADVCGVTFDIWGGYTHILNIGANKDYDAALFYGVAAATPPRVAPGQLAVTDAANCYWYSRYQKRIERAPTVADNMRSRSDGGRNGWHKLRSAMKLVRQMCTMSKQRGMCVWWHRKA